MKKWQYVLIVLIALMVVGVVSLARWLRPYDLATEKAAARAAGVPTTPAEVGITRPPAAQDAYPLWAALGPALKGIPGSGTLKNEIDKYTGPDGLLKPAGRAAARQLSASHAAILPRIREAAARPEAYWPITYSALTWSFETGATMRSAAQILSREAQWLTANDRYRDAAAMADSSFGVSRHAGAAPTAINYLVSVAVDAIALHDLENILRNAGPGAGAATAVRETIESNPPGYDIVRALRGETVFSMNALDTAVALGSPLAMAGPGSPGGLPPALGGLRPPAGWWRSMYIEPSQAAYLHHMTAMLEAARKPDPGRVPAMKRVAGEVRALSAWNPTYLYVRMALPISADIAARGREEDVRRAVLLAAAQVMEYRAKKGRWPARLEDAAPNPPLDPFTGKPLRYSPKPGGFDVRSVGAGSARTRRLAFAYPTPRAHTKEKP